MNNKTINQSKNKRMSAIAGVLCVSMLLGSCSENKAETTTTTASVQVFKETVGDDNEAAAPETTEGENSTEGESGDGHDEEAIDENASDKSNSNGETTKSEETDPTAATGNETDKEKSEDTKALVEEAVNKAVQLSYDIYEKEDFTEDDMRDIYEYFDLESMYYLVNQETADYETAMAFFNEDGDIDLTEITQFTNAISYEDSSWTILDSSPLSDEKNKEIYDIIYGKAEGLEEMSEAYPAFEDVVNALNIEDIWVSTIEVRNKVTDEMLELYTDEMLDMMKQMYGVSMEDGYFVTPMPYIVFKRDGEWRVDMTYTSLYQIGKMFTSGVMDSLIDSFAEGFSDIDFSDMDFSEGAETAE